MKKILGMLSAGALYFCAASFIAIAVGVTTLWAKGSIHSGKVVDLMAAIYGLDLTEMRARIDAAMEDDDQVQIAFERVLEARVRSSLDIDLREAAIEKTLGELINLQNSVISQRNRHDQVVKGFEKRLQEFQDISNDQRLQEVQQTLENMKPKQAKREILMMVKDGAMADVVLIMRAMAVEKQKKIVGEFKTEEEQQILHNILTEVRSGSVEKDLLDGTRDRLKEVDSK